MTARGYDRGSGQIPGSFSWFFNALPLVSVPVLAWLWWALAFLPWTRAQFPLTFETWPPTMPVRLADLAVAVFGPIGASIVVIALLRRAELAIISVLLGFGVSAAVTLTRGADLHGNVLNTTERYLMVAVCAFAAFGGLAIGSVAIRSLRAFGFLGLLAVRPVASLISVVVPGSAANGDYPWLTRLGLVVLLIMVLWRPEPGLVVWVALWPAFFALFWLLNLLMVALDTGAQILRKVGGTEATIWGLADSMLDVLRSAWRVVLELSWTTFWPAALIVALFFAGKYAWGRTQAMDA